jgi:transcriptional regulator with XRE-family HTH domain
VINFEVVGKRLLRYVSLRIRNGDRTERQLAKLVGVSQPQLHNVLKGARPLKRELADALLAHFQISLLDLVEPGDKGSSGRPLLIPADEPFGATRRRPARESGTGGTSVQQRQAS